MQEPTTTTTTTPESTGTQVPETTTTSTTVHTDGEVNAVTNVAATSSESVAPVTVSTDLGATAIAATMTSTPTVGNPSARRQVLKQYGIAALIVVLMGGALLYLLEKQGRVNTGIFDQVSALIMPEAAVAKVNGEKIPQSLYDKNVEQLSLQAATQGADASDPAVAEQIKKQAIDVLVNSTLLKQAARNAGVVVTEEQITERYQGIVASQGGEEALMARMVELKITKDGLMQDIEDEILIQTHLDSAVKTDDITVTDEEVAALYKSVTANPEVKVPPLEEVRPQIEQEIRFGKEQELISAYIDTLKKDAKIEVLI
ncbi:MAG: hypothetical protein RLZZ360_311 [Candidatus Parcubacteria bacterium]|jgi:peptidyl-prolyl cis-trans isomerase SurA